MEARMIKKVFSLTAIIRVAPILAALAISACGGKNPVAVSITGRSQSLTVPIGTQFNVTLQTIGSGEYSSPPTVSSAAVHFLDVSQTAITVPAGPTQRFRFDATTRGKAIIVFQHTDNNPTVEDTVDVR
jgi:beta-lactamase superfamily II metal-dependent hydrolase